MIVTKLEIKDRDYDGCLYCRRGDLPITYSFVRESRGINVRSTICEDCAKELLFKINKLKNHEEAKQESEL